MDLTLNKSQVKMLEKAIVSLTSSQEWIDFLDIVISHFENIAKSGDSQPEHLIDEMLNVLDLENPEDLGLAVEYALGAVAIHAIGVQPFINAALKRMKVETIKGITAIRQYFREAAKYFDKLPADCQVASKKGVLAKKASFAEESSAKDHPPIEAASLLLALQAIQHQQESQSAALEELKRKQGEESSEESSAESEPEEDDKMAHILAAVQNIKHQMNTNAQAIAELTLQQKNGTSVRMGSRDHSNSNATLGDALAVPAIRPPKSCAACHKALVPNHAYCGYCGEAVPSPLAPTSQFLPATVSSTPMTLTHPLVHYRYDAWPSLAKTGSTDRQLLLQTLKQAFACNQSRLNHQRDVNMELLDYLLQDDSTNALKLIGDRCHFLCFLDTHTLQEALHYWHQLRQDERPQRFRVAETSTALMQSGARISSRQSQHLTSQLGMSTAEFMDPLPDHQGGGTGRWAGGRPFQQTVKKKKKKK